MKRALSMRDLTLLSDVVEKLKARLSQLEDVLSVDGHGATLKVGNSSITLTPSKIEIRSPDITLTGTGKVTIKAAGVLTLKGSRILQN